MFDQQNLLGFSPINCSPFFFYFVHAGACQKHSALCSHVQFVLVNCENIYLSNYQRIAFIPFDFVTWILDNYVIASGKSNNTKELWMWRYMRINSTKNLLANPKTVQCPHVVCVSVYMYMYEWLARGIRYVIDLIIRWFRMQHTGRVQNKCFIQTLEKYVNRFLLEYVIVRISNQPGYNALHRVNQCCRCC